MPISLGGIMQQCVMISYFYDKLFIAAFFVFLFIVFLVYKYKVAEPSARILLRTKVKKAILPNVLMLLSLVAVFLVVASLSCIRWPA